MAWVERSHDHPLISLSGKDRLACQRGRRPALYFASYFDGDLRVSPWHDVLYGGAYLRAKRLLHDRQYCHKRQCIHENPGACRILRGIADIRRASLEAE